MKAMLQWALKTHSEAPNAHKDGRDRRGEGAAGGGEAYRVAGDAGREGWKVRTLKRWKVVRPDNGRRDAQTAEDLSYMRGAR
jgi:hypothetical protein